MAGHLRALLLAICLASPGTSVQAQATPGESPEAAALEQTLRGVFTSDLEARNAALGELMARGEPDVVAALIDALRYIDDSDGAMVRALQTLTGATIGDRWHDWMLWQESHPEIRPFVGYDGLKADLMAYIDQNFRLFLRRGVKHEIRLEEITWGGVVKDGIPALVNPAHVRPEQVNYLSHDELVFGVAINGDARAYPLRIMDWHEMFNDVVGGVPVALAYCTLCGSGILYKTTVPPREEPFVFGSSGFLYRSNKLMYDRQTHSLWNQFTGRPVVGPLTGSGILLEMLPVAITSWRDWLTRHPETKVLSLDTGYSRDYRPGRPYGEYFANPALMFPARVTDKRLAPKDYVYVVRHRGQEKAWPLVAFEGGQVVNERLGDADVVLVGDAATRTVRAYASDGRIFRIGPEGQDQVESGDTRWQVTEDALVAADGARLERLPGHIAYWFAWQNFKPDAAFASD